MEPKPDCEKSPTIGGPAVRARLRAASAGHRRVYSLIFASDGGCHSLNVEVEKRLNEAVEVEPLAVRSWWSSHGLKLAIVGHVQITVLRPPTITEICLVYSRKDSPQSRSSRLRSLILLQSRSPTQ